MVDVQKRLTQVCQIEHRPVKDAWGDTAVSSISTVSCFAYYGAYQRREGVAQIVMEGWTVLLPASVTTCATIGDRIQSIIDVTGSTIPAGGKINDIFVYSHRRRGIEVVQAILEPQ